MLKVSKMEPLPANSNPFDHDAFNMGTQLGNNLTVMYSNFEHQKCDYLIVVNTETGERLRISTV